MTQEHSHQPDRKTMFPLHLLTTILPLAEVNRLWYSLPLLVSISLVYSATRHERMAPILKSAAWFAFWTIVVMVGVGILLQVMLSFIG